MASVATDGDITPRPTSSPGTFLFTRKVIVDSEHATRLKGVLAVFLRETEEEERILMIQVLVDNENGSIFQDSFNVHAVVKSMSGDHSDSKAVETLAVLLQDSTSDENGTFRCTFRLQDMGPILYMRIQEHKATDMVLNRWQAKIKRSESATALSFTTSLVDVIHHLEAKEEAMNNQMQDLKADRDDCRDKAIVLSEKWEKEKSDMIQNFLELYSEVQDARGENMLERAKEDRMLLGVATPNAQREQSKQNQSSKPYHSTTSTRNDRLATTELAQTNRPASNSRIQGQNAQPKKRRMEVTAYSSSSDDEYIQGQKSQPKKRTNSSSSDEVKIQRQKPQPKKGRYSSSSDEEDIQEQKSQPQKRRMEVTAHSSSSDEKELLQDSSKMRANTRAQALVRESRNALTGAPDKAPVASSKPAEDSGSETDVDF